MIPLQGYALTLCYIGTIYLLKLLGVDRSIAVFVKGFESWAYNVLPLVIIIIIWNKHNKSSQDAYWLKHINVYRQTQCVAYSNIQHVQREEKYV